MCNHHVWVMRVGIEELDENLHREQAYFIKLSIHRCRKIGCFSVKSVSTGLVLTFSRTSVYKTVWEVL